MKRRVILVAAVLALIGLFGSSCICINKVDKCQEGVCPHMKGKIERLEKRVETLENIAGVKPCLEDKCPKTAEECPIKKSE